MGTRRWRRQYLWSLPAVLLLLGLYGFWIEPDSLRTVQHELVLPDSARVSAEPLRIAVIADLHAGAPHIDLDKVSEVVARTNAAKPDLILLTGDYVIHGVIGGRYMPLARFADRLGALSAPLGVFAVLGNHERWHDAEESVQALRKAGIAVLEDEAIRLIYRGGDLYLVGLSDYVSGPRGFLAALTALPEVANALCFTHSPDVFPHLPARCGLTIAGHTHGGQVLLPIVGRLIVPSRYGQRYAAGHVVEDGKHLFVGTGIGTSILPIRLGVPPEISVLNIR